MNVFILKQERHHMAVALHNMAVALHTATEQYCKNHRELQALLDADPTQKDLAKCMSREQYEQALQFEQLIARVKSVTLELATVTL